MKVILEAQHACNPTPRGIPYYSFQLIRQLLKRRMYDYELTFFDGNREMNNRQWIDKYFGEFNVPVHECNELDYRKFCMSDNILKDKNYNFYTGTHGDIYHFHHLVSIPNNLQGKMVVTIHDMLPVMFPDFFTDVSKTGFNIGIERLNKIKPTIIADSEATKRDILKFTNITHENIFVIPLACNENCFPQSNPNLLKRLGVISPYLLYLGAIDKRKNLTRVLRAFEMLTEKYPDINLVLAGGADKVIDPVISMINDSKYKKRIIMTGYVTDEQKYALYSDALAFLFPSLYEGFGLPVLEAMACGCPVITSNISSLPEVAGDAAVLIDPYDTEQLSHEIERMILSETLRDELKQKGLKQSKNFSWDKTAELTERIYKIAAGEGKK